MEQFQPYYSHSCCSWDRSAASGPHENSSGSKIPAIDGIDIRRALDNLIDEDNLLFALNVFSQGAASEADRLSQFCGAIASCTDESKLPDLMQQYRIKVHAMKSSAATIGALTLSALAKCLEYAARDGNRDRVVNITPAFLEDWNSFLIHLQQALDDLAERPAQKQPCPVDELIVRLLDINEAVEEMKIDKADGLMKELDQYSVPDSICEDMTRLRSAIANIDANVVTEIVKKAICILQSA